MDSNPEDSFNAALTLTDNLDHLPARKRREIASVLETIFDDVRQFQIGKSERKHGKILKVILFGSYARGNWVEDRKSGYRSDYDMLVVVDSHNFAEEEDLWIGLEDRLVQAQIAGHIRTPVGLIVHSLHDVNDQLARGRPFFVDIVRDGKVLYEAQGYPLVEHKPLTPDAAEQEARLHFEQWYQLSKDAVEAGEWMRQKGMLRDSAFMLHQATERAYHCLLLTLTLYSPKSHRIKTLRSKAEGVDARLIEAWPRDNRIARRRFELLARAYVEARYSPKYKITAEELEWLIQRMKVLQDLVEASCTEHLKNLRA